MEEKSRPTRSTLVTAILGPILLSPCYLTFLLQRLLWSLARFGTVTEAEAVTTRQKDVAATGFEVILQEQETEGGHAMETVSWLAWEPGSGEVEDSIEYEADSQAGVTDAFSTLNFSDVHASCFLADMQTFNGPNTATLRYSKPDACRRRGAGRRGAVFGHGDRAHSRDGWLCRVRMSLTTGFLSTT